MRTRTLVSLLAAWISTPSLSIQQDNINRIYRDVLRLPLGVALVLSAAAARSRLIGLGGHISVRAVQSYTTDAWERRRDSV